MYRLPSASVTLDTTLHHQLLHSPVPSTFPIYYHLIPSLLCFPCTFTLCYGPALYIPAVPQKHLPHLHLFSIILLLCQFSKYICGSAAAHLLHCTPRTTPGFAACTHLRTPAHWVALRFMLAVLPVSPVCLFFRPYSSLSLLGYFFFFCLDRTMPFNIAILILVCTLFWTQVLPVPPPIATTWACPTHSGRSMQHSSVPCDILG